MDIKIGSIWKDRYENFSKIKVVKINEDYYKKIEYEWIYCKEEKWREGQKNCLSEKAFFDIYEIINDNGSLHRNEINSSSEKEIKSNNDNTELKDSNIMLKSDTSQPENIKHNYKHKVIKTSSNKIIEIFDDIFTSSERTHHLNYIQNSPYHLGKNSNEVLWQKNKTFFQSPFGRDQLDTLEIFSSKSFDPIRPSLEDQNTINQCWALASTPFSVYYYHTDSCTSGMSGKTLLYYVNDRWDRNWGGETLFSDETGESEYAVQYKPGRIVIFDNSIEHRPASISMEADEFRFIFVAQFLSHEFTQKHSHN